MRKIIALMGAAAAVLTTMAPPAIADAHPRHYRHHHARYESRPERCSGARQRSARTGTVVGAIGGALVGNSMSHGGGGALLGAGVGAVAGHQIGKHNSKCR